MPRLVVSNLMSLDGYFCGPQGEFDWFTPDEEFIAYSRRMLEHAQALLFGRVTYQMMAAYWPAALVANPADPIAERMNALPKYVFSNTLQRAEWQNTRLVCGDAAPEVRRFKQGGERGDLVVLGSAMLASALLTAGLVDEYRVILAPILLGAGKTLFPGIRARMPLKLTRTERLGSGLMVLSYEAAG